MRALTTTLPRKAVSSSDGPVSFHEVPARTNPLGLRGLGECGNPGLGAAIANAVCDALRDRGVTLTALPLTPARILAALRRAGERRAVDIARGRA